MSRSNPPDIADLIERAERGERFALVRLYGMAAAWLADGKAPPAPLGAWLAGRLAEIGALIGDARGKDEERKLQADVLRALRVQRAGTRGRPPSRRAELNSRALAQDVLHFMQMEHLGETAACARVAAYHGTVTAKAVQKAWQEHAATLGKEFTTFCR